MDTVTSSSPVVCVEIHHRRQELCESSHHSSSTGDDSLCLQFPDGFVQQELQRLFGEQEITQTDLRDVFVQLYQGLFSHLDVVLVVLMQTIQLWINNG